MLRAALLGCLLWLESFERRRNVACRFLHVENIRTPPPYVSAPFLFFLKVNVLLWNKWKHFTELSAQDRGDFSTEGSCQKHFSPVLIMKNKPHPVFFFFFCFFLKALQLLPFCSGCLLSVVSALL